MAAAVCAPAPLRGKAAPTSADSQRRTLRGSPRGGLWATVYKGLRAMFKGVSPLENNYFT